MASCFQEKLSLGREGHGVQLWTVSWDLCCPPPRHSPQTAWPESGHRWSWGQRRPLRPCHRGAERPPVPPSLPIWSRGQWGWVLTLLPGGQLDLDKRRAHCWFSDQAAVGPSGRTGHVQAGGGEALGLRAWGLCQVRMRSGVRGGNGSSLVTTDMTESFRAQVKMQQG